MEHFSVQRDTRNISRFHPLLENPALCQSIVSVAAQAPAEMQMSKVL